jgi:rubrerythrin
MANSLPVNLDVKKLTLKDALDLAILVEEEAANRYLELSKSVGGRYQGDASDMFKMMIKNEAKHMKQLKDKRKKLFKGQRRVVTRDMLFDVEAPDYGAIRFNMSARQALEVALASEEKAHDFFAAASKAVKDPKVKKLFLELKEEEREHKVLLKKRIAKLPKGADVEIADIDEPGSDAG